MSNNLGQGTSMPSVSSMTSGMFTNTSQQIQQSPLQGSSQQVPMGSQTYSGTKAPTAGEFHIPKTPVLSKARLAEIAREVDPTVQMDEDVEEMLLQLADDFIDNTVNAACLFAKHRRATTVEVKDVQLHLERTWNMWIPGFGTEEVKPYKRAAVTEAHKQRMNLIKKTIKKY